MYRRFSVLVALLVVMVLVLPGAAFAGPLPRSANAPDAPLLLNWVPRSTGGFGDKNNAAVSALEVFGGQLYAGTTSDLGAQIWRTADGNNWTRVTVPGFGNSGNGVLFDMIVFNGQLFAGTGAWPVHSISGQIWRTSGGTAWNQVTGPWNTNPNNAGLNNFAFFGGALYVTTYNPVNGVEVYRSGTGNSGDWVRVASGSFGLNAAYGIATGLMAFNNALYVALEGYSSGAGMRVYRSFDGLNWEPANSPGFGSTNNYGAGGFAVHRGMLYVGTLNSVSGGQIWRSADGTSWSQVGMSGFGNQQNYKIEGIVSVMGTLFAFSDNDNTGTEVWSSSYGTDWTPSNNPGFGSANNKAVALWSNGAGLLANQVFLGTFNQATGGEVWSATPPTVVLPSHKFYLPFIGRG